MTSDLVYGKPTVSDRKSVETPYSFNRVGLAGYLRPRTMQFLQPQILPRFAGRTIPLKHNPSCSYPEAHKEHDRGRPITTEPRSVSTHSRNEAVRTSNFNPSMNLNIDTQSGLFPCHKPTINLHKLHQITHFQPPNSS